MDALLGLVSKSRFALLAVNEPNGPQSQNLSDDLHWAWFMGLKLLATPVRLSVMF